MGDVADMMLDGTLCEGCGVHLNDEAPGYPCYCDDCGGPGQEKPKQRVRNNNKIQCPQCQKWVKQAGLEQHIQDSHVEKPEVVEKPAKVGNFVLDKDLASEIKKSLPQQVVKKDHRGYGGKSANYLRSRKSNKRIPNHGS